MKHKWTALWLTLALFCTLLAGCEALQPPSQSQGTAPSPGETLTVHFIDVGQADAALLLCGGETMLIDGGNAEDRLEATLQSTRLAAENKILFVRVHDVKENAQAVREVYGRC